ncbi:MULTISPECIES: NAD-dependent epimerase/dehydratase family protein [Pseudomonas]|uniref:NAD-dependent epimerase/dehydratase family protein n=1 Tax=Pseudomonas TaxID=286 RepID=UPI001F42CE0B|nr:MULTISPECIES: NAD-dependent epimerase/dehydratase family protein [Pseudomonas]UII16906.1 ADP-L-glycero-D-manno-heptose-6-epimerase [Pseudomonas brassicacearum]
MILLTGAKGFIGSQLLSRLCESGHSVRLVTRSSFECDFNGVEIVHADLTSAETNYESLFAGCDVVFNCAGEIHNEELMQALHVDATERLVATANRLACKEHPIHFVQLSSVGAYGPARGVVRVVNELTLENPQGTYETTKTIGDSRVAKNRDNQFFTYSILRPSNVFGKSMTNNSLRQLGKIVRRGLFFYIGAAKKKSVATYIHVDDVVSALMLCGFDPRAKGEVFNLSNDCALSDLINGMADAQHVTRPRWSLPEAPLRLMVSLVNRFSALPVTQARIDALVARTRYPSTKLLDTLGFIPEREVPAVICELFVDKQAG